VSTPPLIAIVDDDQELRDALTDLLEVAGLAARTFESAEAFLATHAPGVFAAVVTDVRMGAMSGLDLVAHLRASEPSLPVLVVTSAADGPARAVALERGAAVVLPKPFDAATLLAALTRALDPRP